MSFWVLFFSLRTLAAEPSAGLNAVVDSARSAVAQGNPEAASTVLLGMYSTEDAATVAARGDVAAAAAGVFAQTSMMYRSKGLIPEAIRDADAAWLLSGRGRDAEYARTLTNYARTLRREGHSREAAFVALRAVEADPQSLSARNVAALTTRSRGERSARDALVIAGAAAVVAGVGAWVASDATATLEQGAAREALDTARSKRRAGIAVTYVAGGVAGGAAAFATLQWRFGAGPVIPVSPAFLPAWGTE